MRNEEAIKIASMVKQKVLVKLGYNNGIRYLNVFNENEINLINEKIEITTESCDKKIKDPNRVDEFSLLIPSDICKKWKYLNITIDITEYARMAEGLMQFVNTKCPSGLMGPNPIPGVFSFFVCKVNVGNCIVFPSGGQICDA